MNFFKRATTSILRRPGKTIILLLLIFILGTVISGAISVEGAVSNTNRNLRNGMRPVVSFSVDEDAMSVYAEETGEWPEWPSMTADKVREIADLPYVSQVNYSVRTWFSTTALKEYHPEMQEGESHFSVTDSEMAWFSLQGTSVVEPLPFSEGLLEMVDGRTFTDAELGAPDAYLPLLVSEGFADVNHLSVGSTFDITIDVIRPQLDWGNWDPEWESNEENIFASEVFTFEIIGIFDAVGNSDQQDDNGENPGMSNEDHMVQERIRELVRALYTPNSAAIVIQRFQDENARLALEETVAIENIDLDSEDYAWITQQLEREDDQPAVTAIMELHDVSDLEAFRAEATPLLPDFMVVNDLSNAFDNISSSMETLQGIAFWVLVVSVGATLLILSLLITLFLRDRRYEMGVYLALGEKKSRIISQILIEVVATAFIAITLAVFTGNLISGTMSRTMLRNELLADNDTNQIDMGWCIGCDPLEDMGFTQEMSPEEMLQAFDVSINIQTIGLFYVVGLGAVIFSTIVPVIYVVTLNPKKVLM
jgi:putative ABC transport system permease protein